MLSVAVAIGGAASVYYPFTHAARMQVNLTLAHDHAKVVGPMLAKDARFTGVHITDSAREGGVLRVTGAVSSDEALRELRQAIEATNPPVGVIWSVEVNGKLAATHPAM